MRLKEIEIFINIDGYVVIKSGIIAKIVNTPIDIKTGYTKRVCIIFNAG